MTLSASDERTKVSMRRALLDLTSTLRRSALGKSGRCLKWQFGGRVEMFGLGWTNDAKLLSKKSL
jgi:hypothetical protein